MSVNITFGECLSSILHALNLRSSKLAKEMNIDSSLVYKWLRNERVPSYETQYIDQISRYIAKRINNTYQKEELLNLFIKYDINLSDANGTAISDLLKKILQEAQGYSIRQRTATKRNERKAWEPANTLNNIDIRKHALLKESRLSGRSEFLEMLSCSSDCFQIIKSRKWISCAETELLKKAACTRPSSGENTILITYNIEMDVIYDCKWRYNWIKALRNVINNGWHIVFQVMCNNIKSKMLMVEALQILLTCGSVKIYYQKISYYTNLFYKEYIVPGIGVLTCFPPAGDPEMSKAFLFQSRESIIALTELFAVRQNSAKPLLNPYPPQKIAEFQHTLAEVEEMFGDKFVVKDGLSTVTMPAGIYEKYLRESGKQGNEISYRLFLHKRRLDSFNVQIKYYRYKEICFLESLERLVNEHEYSFDEKYILGGGVPDAADIECHLYNVIEMLQEHDNYELAIINKKQLRHFANINWAVKDKCCVLIESDSTASLKNLCKSEKNYTITEESIVTAFTDYFHMIWEQIPENCKDKTETIKRLKDYIERVQQKGTDYRIANA